MKIFWRTVRMLLFIGVMFIFQVKFADSQTLDICTNPISGSSCRLTCTTTDVSQPINFLKLPAGIEEGGCTSGGSCAVAPLNTRYTASQNVAQSETYLDISSLVYADDDSQWGCVYGSALSSAVQLTVIVPPTTCTLTESGGTYTCTSSCGYPASDMSIKAKLDRASQELTPSAVSTPACTSPESAYSATVPASFISPGGNLNCECAVSGIASTAVPSNSLTVPAPTTPAATTTTPASNTCVIVGSIGLVFAVICLVITWIVYLGANGTCTCLPCSKPKSGLKSSLISCDISWLLWISIGVSILCGVAITLCIAGLALKDNGTCESGTRFSLSLAGMIFSLVLLIIEIFIWIGICSGMIKICGHHVTETNTVKPGNANVTDDQKGQAKGEEGQQQGEKDSEHIKATPDEMKGVSDKKPEAV